MELIDPSLPVFNLSLVLFMFGKTKQKDDLLTENIQIQRRRISEERKKEF